MTEEYSFKNDKRMEPSYLLWDGSSLMYMLLSPFHTGEIRYRVHKKCGGKIRAWNHKVITMHYFYECEKCKASWEIYSSNFTQQPVASMVNDFHNDIEWKWFSAEGRWDI